MIRVRCVSSGDVFFPRYPRKLYLIIEVYPNLMQVDLHLIAGYIHIIEVINQ